MPSFIFKNVSEKDKSDAIGRLISDSSPNFDFFLMISLSIVMATFGLLLNSAAIIIGSMLIAPMLFPLLSFSLGIILTDHKLISLSFYTIIKASAYSIAVAAVVAAFFAPSGYSLSNEILARTDPSLPYFIVAIIAGFAASFALIKPQLNERLSGVAISVALIPPIAVIGIGIAQLDWFIIKQSFILFLINVLGVVFASVITFSLMNLRLQRKVVTKAVRKENPKITQAKS